MRILGELQEWYESQCNEDWEHQFGVSIGTLDNPGWTVTIHLDSTDLADEAFHTIEDLSPGRDWIKCWVESGKFNGVGGPQKLDEILTIFLRWAQKKES
jgi:immunity protein 53 of polymorphic toxin system